MGKIRSPIWPSSPTTSSRPLPAATLGKALDYAQRAGDRAAEAARLRGGRALLPAGASGARVEGAAGDPRSRATCCSALGDALARAGSTPRAKEAFLAAAELARSPRSREHLARAALGYGGGSPGRARERDTGSCRCSRRRSTALGDEESVLRVQAAGAPRRGDAGSALARAAVDTQLRRRSTSPAGSVSRHALATRLSATSRRPGRPMSRGWCRSPRR